MIIQELITLRFHEHMAFIILYVYFLYYQFTILSFTVISIYSHKLSYEFSNTENNSILTRTNYKIVIDNRLHQITSRCITCLVLASCSSHESTIDAFKNMYPSQVLYTPFNQQFILMNVGVPLNTIQIIRVFRFQPQP